MYRDCIDTRWPNSDACAAQYPGIGGGLTSVADNLVSQVVRWRERARSRHLLRQLDDRMLRDVGLSLSDVDREGAKHFWQR